MVLFIAALFLIGCEDGRDGRDGQSGISSLINDPDSEESQKLKEAWGIKGNVCDDPEYHKDDQTGYCRDDDGFDVNGCAADEKWDWNNNSGCVSIQ